MGIYPLNQQGDAAVFLKIDRQHRNPWNRQQGLFLNLTGKLGLKIDSGQPKKNVVSSGAAWRLKKGG